MQPLRKLLSLAAVLLVLPSPPAEAQAAPAATVGLSEGALVVVPSVPYDSAVLAVSGQDRQALRRVFEPQEAIVFTPVDEAGFALADGSYRWALRLIANVPMGVGGEVEARLVGRVSGSFDVIGGGIRQRVPLEQEAGPEGVNDVTITDATPSLIFEDTTVGDDDYSVDVDADVMSFVRDGTEEFLTFQSGVVGVFNAAPDPDVELHIADALPEIRLDGSAGVWDLRVSTDDFQIVDDDELFPPTVLEIEKTGSTYDLVFDGDGIFNGDFTAGSSRTIKRDLELAPKEELLETLRELPLYAWSYKKDAEGVRHVGPMAEDFHEAFGLGRDDKHISPGDTAGLALIAIQALTERLEASEREVATLRARLQALESSQ